MEGFLPSPSASQCLNAYGAMGCGIPEAAPLDASTPYGDLALEARGGIEVKSKGLGAWDVQGGHRVSMG